MIVRTLMFAFPLIIIPAVCHDSIFYCDPIRGSPQGDGSIESPWRTVEEVLLTGHIQLCDQDGKPVNPDAPVLKLR